MPGTDVSCCLAAYDKDGNERSDDPDGRMSDAIAKSIRDDAVTDVCQSHERRRMYWELSKLRHDMNAVPHYEPTGDEVF